MNVENRDPNARSQRTSRQRYYDMNVENRVLFIADTFHNPGMYSANAEYHTRFLPDSTIARP